MAEAAKIGNRPPTELSFRAAQQITVEMSRASQSRLPLNSITIYFIPNMNAFCSGHGRSYSLIPPPRSHLIRWSGVFAPASKYRKDITLDNSKKKGFQFENSRQEECKKNIKNSNWSKMLARTFKIDVTKCIYWRSDMYVVAAILKKEEIQRYLTHEKLDPNPPARAPPVEKELNLSDATSNVIYLYG